MVDPDGSDSLNAVDQFFREHPGQFSRAAKLVGSWQELHRMAKQVSTASRYLVASIPSFCEYRYCSGMTVSKIWSLSTVDIR
jgi:hypothetical protein